jgi:hypothetical protein
MLPPLFAVLLVTLVEGLRRLGGSLALGRLVQPLATADRGSKEMGHSKPFDATLKDMAGINPAQFLVELEGPAEIDVVTLQERRTA